MSDVDHIYHLFIGFMLTEINIFLYGHDISRQCEWEISLYAIYSYKMGQQQFDLLYQLVISIGLNAHYHSKSCVRLT